jgi:tetratricopeptide (TPR) repeat protein
LAQYKSQVQASLHYWQQKTKDFSHKNIIWLDDRRANLLKSIEEGFRYEDLWEETAVVISQVFHFMEWRGYWRSWIPTLETIIQQCPNQETTLYASLISQLAQFHRLNRGFAEARRLNEVALQIANRLQDNTLLAAIYREVGQSYLVQNQLDDAERNALLALAHIEQVPEKKRINAFILQTLGIIKRLRGQYEPSLVYFDSALVIRRELQESILLADVLNEMALTFEFMQDYDAAHRLIDEALAIINQTNNESMRTLFLMNKGVFYYRQNRLPDAEMMFQQVDFFALKRQGNLFQCGLAMQNLGNVLLKQGKVDEAEPYVQEAIQLFRPTHDEVHLANSLGTLGEILAAQKRTNDAAVLLDEAIELLQKYPDNTWAQKLLGNSLQLRGSL